LWGRKYDQGGEKMPIITIKEGPMPNELYLKLTKVIYQMCAWGVPIGGTIEVGRVIMDNYWRDKNAGKNGG
jgi:hypothetical protein